MGNPGHRPIPETPNFTPGDNLRPPDRWPAVNETKTEGFERQEWVRIVPDLVKAGIAKAVHQGVLEKICELYAASVTLYEAKDYAGARMQTAEYRKALNECGLTPASAGRVGFLGGSGANGDENEGDEFFKKPRLVG